tara:strand:- start:5102 stop:5644 length:543 start_codon:yes stop_codon:yes gene_type:complete
MEYTIIKRLRRSAMATCPICQNTYSASRVPYSLQPCGHGMCKDCAIQYFDERLEVECPVCRCTVLRRVVNWDLKSVCGESLEGWKQKLMDALKIKPGLSVDITDAILPAAPLILHRVQGNRDVHEPLLMLTRHVSAEDAYMWVDCLQFPPDWDVERKLTRILRHSDFLEKFNAQWVQDFL